MKFSDETGGCAAVHIGIGCPEREWREGSTMKSYYDGQLNHITVYRTSEEAARAVLSAGTWIAKQIKQYEDMNLDVPPQYFLWRYEVV